MKILFVLEHYYPYIGGAEQLFQFLAESLAKQQKEVTVITTRYDKSLPEKEIINNVEIIRINCRNRFLFSLFVLPHLFRIIRKFDIIHTTTYTAAFPTWIATTLFQKKCFLTFHEYWGQLWFSLPFLSKFEKNIFYLFERIIFKLPFYKIIAVSQFTKNTLIKNGKKENNVIQIYNGLNDIHFKNHQHQKPDEFTATYFGRLGVSKGLDLLIPAIHQHLKNHPDSHFNLVIPSVPQKMYKEIIQLIGNYQQIQVHQHLTKVDLHNLISHSSCVLIPSYSEGFCFAAVESIAIGTPIIHSNQGALQETVSGHHIKMKDMTIASLKTALEAAYKNQWKRTTIRSFPLQTSVNAYLKLYADLLNNVSDHDSHLNS